MNVGKIVRRSIGNAISQSQNKDLALLRAISHWSLFVFSLLPFAWVPQGLAQQLPAGQGKPTPSLSVSTSGTPSVYGIAVTFTATISSGPTGSITFYDGSTVIGTGTINGTTASLNISTLKAGSHSITAYYPGAQHYKAVTSSPITQAVNKATPVITWPTPSPITYGTALGASQLDATANTAGTFVYSPVSGTLLNAGTQTLAVTFTATDTGDYNGATDSVTLTVNKATPSLSLSSSSNPSLFNSSVTFTATISNGLSGSVTFYDGSSIIGSGVISGATAIYATSSLTAGTHVITASWVGNANYNSVTSAPVSEAVNKAAPSITWPTPAPIMYGTALSTTQLNASSNLPGTFAYTPSSGTILSAGSHTLSTTFTPTDSADYSTATSSVILTVNKATPSITWPAPAPITYGTALSSLELNASSSVPGSFAYSPASGVVLTAGAQTLSVAFTPSDTTDYNPATSSVSLTVNKATPSIVWPTPAPITYGTALSSSELNASSSVQGTFSYSPASGTVLGAGSQMLSVSITPSDATDYNTATSSVTLTVNKATPTITWASPAPITYGTALGSSQLNASSSIQGTFSYNPASGTVLGAGSQTLSVTFTPSDTTDYNTATSSVTLTVNKATPTITWQAPGPITYGTALGSSQLNASTNVPGTFSYTPSSGTVLSAGTQTLSVTFAPTDSTDYNTATSSVSLTVNKATPTISWPTPPAITYGTALSSTELNASASTAGTLSYTPPSGTVLSAGTQTLSVSFTPSDTTDYNDASTSVSLTVNKATPSITWSSPAAITYGTPLSAAQLNASSTVVGSFAYTPAAGAVLTAGSHSLSTTLTPTDSVDYNAATASVTLTVNQATPAITWTAPASISYGTPLSSTQLNASGSVPGTFAYTPPAGTILPVGTDTLSVTLSPTDSVDYTSATETVSIIVKQVSFALPPPGEIVTMAGNGTQGYLGDGAQALSAELNAPSSIAVDASGNTYIADAQNNVIREVLVSNNEILTIAGTGIAGYSGDGGPATAAQLNAPTGVRLDSAGNLYIADTANSVLRELNLTSGIIHTIAGTGIAGYSGDGGSPGNAQLNSPTEIALDPSGNLYVADSLNNVIRKIDASGTVISTFAGSGVAGNAGDGGPAQKAELSDPTSIAIDPQGNLYIADTGNQRIRRVSLSTGVISAFAGQGQFGFSGDGGPALNAQFGNPTGLATDANGNLYITDVGNSVIREVSAATGIITTIAGNGSWGYSGDGGPATAAQLGIDQVDAVAIDVSGNVYIADFDNNVVRVVGGVKATPTLTVSASPSIVPFGAVSSTLTAVVSSGTGTVSFTNGAGWNSGQVAIVNGSASATLSNAGWSPGLYTISASYSGDALDNPVNGSTTLSVTSTAKTTPTISWPVPLPITVGTALSSTQLNATASVPGTFVYSPAAGTIPPAGSDVLSVLFVPTDNTDYNAATATVTLSVNPSAWGLPGSGMISTVAGDGTTGYSGDGGIATSAELSLGVSGIAVDAAGNIYVADWENNVVRKISAISGIISTVAGNGGQGYSGDTGVATSAELDGPAAVAVDAIGNIYIADSGNNVIRKVAAGTGVISTIAGTGVAAYTGDNGPATQATLNFPYGLAVSTSGDLFIADMGNNVVREVAVRTGTITTAAGNGTAGYTGDGAPAAGATLSSPSNVAIDNSGNLYITDLGNNSIRVVFNSGNIPGLAGGVSGNIYTLVGTGSTAQINAPLNSPESVAVDASGNVYIADAGNNLIRVVYESGTIPNIANPTPGSLYTLAGNGTPGYSGDGGPATNAELNTPGGVATDGSGRIYIADTNNELVRAIGTAAKSIVSINWPTPSPIVYGTALGAAELNATTSAPGTLVYEPPSGLVLTAGSQPLGVTFIPNDPSAFAVGTSTTTMIVNQATPTISWPTPPPITPGTALGAVELNATSSVPGTFVYSPAAGAIPPLGPLTITATFTPTDAVDYTTATASVTMTVAPVTPTINWPTPAPITYGTPLSTAQLFATASVPGSFTFNPSLGTVLAAGTATLTATFTPNDIVAYTTATATVPLVVNQALPVINWPTPSAITSGTPLSSAQLNATANVAGTFAYSPEAGVVPPVGASTLTATFSPADATDYASATAQVQLAVNETLAPGTPLLQLRANPTPNTVTLSNSQDLDWIIWGTDGSTLAATRMSGANLISDITPLGGASIAADLNGQVAYSWSGGTPTAQGTAVTAETYTSGAGAGYQITAPADTSVKTLLLYVNINANAQLTASISDGTSPAVVHVPTTTKDSGNEIYAIDYRAGSSGQTLTVQLVSTDSTANIGLEAAVLEPHLPEVDVLSPVSTQSYPLTGVPVIVNATQFDVSVASVQLIVNGTNSALLTSAPFETSLVLPAGHYSIAAQAIDGAGLTNTSAPVQFDVIKSGGSLSDTFSQLDPSTAVDLTSEGTADWTTFAPAVYGQPPTERKGGVVPAISDYTIVGAGLVSTYSALESFGQQTFSYEDGNPDPAESTIFPWSYLVGEVASTPAFQFTVPADTSARTLRLYAESCGSDVQLTAFLSDGSAPPLVDNSLTDSLSSIENVFSINYAAATPGQTLTVRLALSGVNNGSWGLGQNSQGEGVVCLTAATLAGGQPAPPTVTAITPASGGTGTTVTIAGFSFGATQGNGTVTIGGAPLSVQTWTDASIQAVLPQGIQSGPVAVTTAIGTSNTDVLFTLAPTVSSISPSVGPIGTTVTITGANLGASQGAGTVTFNGVPANATEWTDTQIVASVPAGATTGHVTVTQGAPASVAPLFVVSAPGGQATSSPLLYVRLDDSPMTVNLDDAANQDWVLWGSDGSSTAIVRKNGANLIGNLSTPGFQNDAWQGSVQYSWTNGSPTPSGTKLNAGVYGYGTSAQFTVPADTTVRTLKIYSSITFVNQLTISVSDNSSPAITYVPPPANDYGERVFSIDYRAASAGQTLTVTMSSVPNSGRGIILEALVLQPHLPQVKIVSPADGTEFAAGTGIPFGVDTWQFDSTIGSIGTTANGTELFTLQPGSTSQTWNPSSGHYSLQAQVTDSTGLSNQSQPISVDVIGTGGTLTQTNSPIAANVDLTSLGTADWVLYQYCGGLPYYGEIRKSGVAAQISDLKILGDEFAPWGDNSTSSNFSFEDGTPDGQDTTQPCGATIDNGVVGNGFAITAPADTNPRTLYLFVANWQARGKLKAFLSDGSAPVVIDTSVVSQLYTTNYGSAEYAIHFSAASPGQTLTVQWTGDETIHDPGYNVDAYTEVYAAALDGPPAMASAGPEVESLTPESGSVGTSVTIKGSGFGNSQATSTVTFNGSLATPTSWTDTQIQVPVPLADNSGYVIVTVGGASSQPVLFNMPPTITGLSCSFCVAGSTITINGYNFGSSQVRFSFPVLASTIASAFSAIPQVLSWTDTQIQVVMPSVPTYWGTQMILTIEKVDPFSNASGESISNASGFTTSSTPLAPVVQWQTPAPITFGTPLGTTQLNATASIPGTFAYNPSAGTVLPAGPVVLTATFTPTDTADYTTSAVQVNLEVNKAIPSLSWQQPAPITYGTALSSVQLDATASIPGQFVYNPPAGSVPIKGTDSLYATFVPTDAVDYQSTTASVNLVVNAGKAGIEIPPPGMVGTFVGNGTKGSTGDGGLATGAEINSPYGMAVDASGNVYLADTDNNVVREVNAATGVITAVAGNYSAGYSGDGGPAINAQLNNPYGVAVDLSGNLYIADSINNAIRKVDATTGTITTLVGDGSGKAGYAGDSGPANAARLNYPTSVAVDSQGNLYIADWANNAVREVLASNGTINTVIGDGTGTAGYLGDGGPATKAELNQPFGVAVDTNGNLYVSDSYNNRVREVAAATQVITTIAGNGTQGYLADNGPATAAELSYPLGIALDASGNLYIADWMNNAVREVGTNGVITTVMGNGTAGYSGDGGLGTQASLNGPAAIATDALVAIASSSNVVRSKSKILSQTVRAMDASSSNGAGNDLFLGDTGNDVGRIGGGSAQATPPFPVPAGQYLAWSYPTNGMASGNATATPTSGSLFGPGAISWTGFTMPASIPLDATIQGIQAVVQYSATGLNGLTATLSVDGQNFGNIASDGPGVAYSGSLGTSLPGTITASLSGSGSGTFIVNSVAVAILFTTPMPGGNCPKNVLPTYGPFALVDPYSLGSAGNLAIDPTDAINAALGGQTASGFIADGTSTAIAVLQITPGSCQTLPFSVTLEVDNGGTLSPWDPAFLNTAPGPASTSGSGITLDINHEQFVSYNGNYYALALVTSGTPATSSVWDTTYVSLAAPQSSNVDPQQLVTYPVPAILIHGIWGDAKSLANTQAFLNATNTSNYNAGITAGALDGSNVIAPAFFAQVICYGKDQLFNADSFAAGSLDCTANTPGGALDAAIESVYEGLEGAGVIGTRFDVIAHSMGGLVVRNFADLADANLTNPYFSPRNRMQGTFRDIVTLDTPEVGSTLAPWLSGHFADLTKNQGSKAWTFYCGLSAKTTVASCLANKGKPLAPVQGLNPDSPFLASLPGPNLPNSVWYAVAAQFLDQQTNKLIQSPAKGDSLLRDLFAALLSATYPSGQSQFSYTYMQGNIFLANNTNDPTSPSVETMYVPQDAQHNDAMVVQKSEVNDPGLLVGQFATGSPAETYTPQGLSHTGVGALSGPLLDLFFHASSNNVTHNCYVNAQAIAWLGYSSGAPTCNGTAPASQNQPIDKMDQWLMSSETDGVQMTETSGRLSAEIPEVPMRLAVPTQLRFDFTRSDVVSVTFEQLGEDGTTDSNYLASNGSPVGSGEAKVLLDGGTSKVFEFIPLQIGKVTLKVVALFADGAIERQQYSVKVIPNAAGIKEFRLNGSLISLPIVLDSGNPDPRGKLAPMVRYENLEEPIYLDSSSLDFEVEQSEGDPVIRLDKDGLVHALRPGTATIIGNFDGVSAKISVHVYDEKHAFVGHHNPFVRRAP